MDGLPKRDDADAGADTGIDHDGVRFASRKNPGQIRQIDSTQSEWPSKPLTAERGFFLTSGGM